MRQVLSGKTLNEETLTYARTLNLDVQCMNFIEVTQIPFNIELVKNADFDAIAFTSLNSVKFFASNAECKKLMETKKVFSLSGATAGILLKIGIKPFATANDAATLAAMIIESTITKSILHPSGSLKLDVLQQNLSKANINYHPLLVYKTDLNETIKTDKNFDAVMFFSPSGVDSFLNVNTWNAKTIACCIGKTTGEAFRNKQPDANIITPILPSPESMLKKISNYFQTHKAEA